MAGELYFTNLNASNAFWQIQVDVESSRLLIFNFPCGRFRFLRISYGIHKTSEVCQALIATIIESTDECQNALDNIIIWADTLSCLKKKTIEILQAARRSGLKLNRSKCQFYQCESTSLGHTISNKGMASGARKIKAIADMPELINEKELQRFLDMIPYCCSPVNALNANSPESECTIEK